MAHERLDALSSLAKESLLSKLLGGRSRSSFFLQNVKRRLSRLLSVLERFWGQKWTLCFWGRIMLLVLRVCDWRSVWLTFCVIAHFNFLSLSQCHISLLWPLLNAKFRHYRTLILSHFNSLALQLSCNHIYFKISKLNTSCILTVQTTPQLCWH